MPTSPAPIAHEANGSIGTATPAHLVAFAHAALFSPSLTTLVLALAKGYIPNLPGLSTATLRCHPPNSAAMVKGHLDQSRQNQRSTRPTLVSPEAKPLLHNDVDLFPTAPVDCARSHFCYIGVMEPTGQIFTNQTGRFVAPSINGNNYLLVIYDYDSNNILAEPMKTRTGASILTAYKTLHSTLCAAGLPPELQRLDNECSKPLKEFMHS
jgi:hypothetical protein